MLQSCSRVGGGSNVVGVSLDLEPSAGAVSNYGDGETISGGLFDGLKVIDPLVLITYITDDGTECTVTLRAGGAAFNSIAALTNNVRIYYPTPLMGDFDLGILVSSDGSNAGRRVGPVAWQGTGTASNGGYRVVRWGAWTGTDGEIDVNRVCLANKAYDGDLYSWATPRWLGIARAAQDCKNRDGGTGADPSWTELVTDQNGPEGGTPYVGVMLYAGSNNDSFGFRALRLTGFEYTAAP